MAVKASATVTISHIIDISAITRYYMLQSSTAAAPAKPTTVPALIGKNAFNIAFALNVNNWVNYKNGYSNYRISGLKPNAMYTFSMSANNWSGVKNNGFYVSINNTPSTYSSHPIAHSNGIAGYNPKKGTLESNSSGEIYLQFYNVSADRLSTFFNGCPNFQLELGSAATEYQKYVTPNWQLTEPAYTSGSTNTLYFVDCTEFTNGTFKYSEVSKSSSYEAAKAAYNKAQNAQNNVDSLTTRVSEAEANIELNKKSIELRATKTEVETTVNNIKVGGRNILLNSSFKKSTDEWNVATPVISGEGYLYADDVSPVEHDINCAISRKNLLSAMSLFPTVTNNAIPIHFKAGQKYTISFTATYTAWRLMFFGTDKNGTAFDNSSTDVNKYISNMYTGTTGRLQHASNQSGNTFTFTCNEDCIITAVVFWNVKNETGKTYSKFQLEMGDTATAHTPYIPDLMAVKIKRLGKNLFDKDNANILTAYFAATGDVLNTNAKATRSIWIPCLPNTTYTVSKIASARFAVGFTNEEPMNGVAVNNAISKYTTEITVTSGNDDKYIIVWFYNSNVETSPTVEEILASMQIEFGAEATDYEPYITPIEYTPSSNGTVSGIKSISPNMTLISDTDGVILRVNYRAGAFVEKYGKQCIKFSNKDLKYNKYCMQQLIGKIEPNTQYTLSGWILSEHVTKGSTNPLLSLYTQLTYNNNGTTNWKVFTNIEFDINASTGTWKYVSTTFTSSDEASLSNSSDLYFAVFMRDVIGEFYFYNLKLEKGNKATDWEPAYEDTKTDIEKVAAIANSNKESISSLLINTDSISASVSKLQTDTSESIDGIKEDISTLKHAVDVAITSEDVQIQIQNEMSKGSTKVVTNTGFTFDEDGLTINKSNSPTNTHITENGMTVNNTESGEAVLTANKDGVDAANLKATTYLIIGGRSRFENYGTNRTGCFWIGE